MSNLNDTKIEKLTNEQVQLCHALLELSSSSDISRHDLDVLAEKLCDISESIDLRANLLR